MSDIDVYKIVTSVIALMVAIIGHEIMHGLAAYYHKDTTAKEQGRLSLNPIVHIDLVGTILLPTLLFLSNAPFMFGWAKPVPINPNIVLRNGNETGMIVVSLAGIIYNLSVALICSVIVYFYEPASNAVETFLYLLLINLIIYNILLAIFNLYPIPPLDGSKAMFYLSLKLKLYSIAKFFNKIEKYGMIILLIIVATPLSKIVFEPITLAINFILKNII